MSDIIYSRLVSNILGRPNGTNRDEILALVTHFLQLPQSCCTKWIANRAKEIIRDYYSPMSNDLIARRSNLCWHVPFPHSKLSSFRFIELFAGIGGFRLGLQGIGGRCVFASEIDYHAKRTYQYNFGLVPFGDIKEISSSSHRINNYIPKHDVLTAGFPCQPFSHAGKRAGFLDTRGTLFYNIEKIIKAKKPQAFILENVLGLGTHRGGATIRSIMEILRDKIGYYVHDPIILNALDFGVPQHRQRIFIIGFRLQSAFNSFCIPEKKRTHRRFKHVKESKPVNPKYYLSEGYLDTLKKHKMRESDNNNNFGYKIVSENGYANALMTGGAGREMNLVVDKRKYTGTFQTKKKSKINDENIRFMTPREWARLMGFPQRFKLEKAGTSDTQAYIQLGNAVCVPSVSAIGRSVVKALRTVGK